MYLGFLAVLGGLAVLASTVAPILVFAVMVWLLTVHLVIPEERHMPEQFGERYRQYQRDVRRWL
jgi:protein-S-isoprenylcysteine O-methyltransferase Ste14